jgi:hypothetical protein
VKLVVNDLIENYDCRPKKVLEKLSLKRYRNQVDIMPTIEQVRTYIKNQRKQAGDINDLDKLGEYMEGVKFQEGIDDDKLFAFGAELGDGSEGNHFHLGKLQFKEY